MNFRLFLSLSAIAVLTVCGAIFGSRIAYQTDKARLVISSTPNNALIKINGKTVKSSGVYLNPGKYSISVITDDYYEYRAIQEIKSDDIKISIDLTKKPPALISSILHSENYSQAIDKYPIIKSLPYNSFFFNIDYSPYSTMDSLEIDITAYDGYYQSAIDKIKDWGYNPAEYNIKFLNYENPFES